jgi:hypothetical protein
MARMIFTKAKECKITCRRLPVILHSCWESPAGEKALFLVNYTDREQRWSYRGHSGSLPPRSWDCRPQR